MGGITSSLTKINVNGLGAVNAVPFSVAEAGYTGSFVESDTCTGIATIATTSAIGPMANYLVTGTNSGTCSVTIRDAFGQQQTIPVVVTTSGFTVAFRSLPSAKPSARTSRFARSLGNLAPREVGNPWS